MPDKIHEQLLDSLIPANAEIFGRSIDILEEARGRIARTVNSAMVTAYWLIGREIVEEEQKGQKRAEYGKALLQDLSRHLNKQNGKGFSVSKLQDCRKCYLTYPHRLSIQHPTGDKFTSNAIGHSEGEGSKPKQHPMGVKSATGFNPKLSWSHYRALMRVENEEARQFYEQEAARSHWTKLQLQRQINTLLFERLLKSRDKDGVLEFANEGQTTEHPIEIIKDPYALEFLGIPESHRLLESDLETALTTHIQDFLLELGTGFAFVARQRRLTLDGDHFYADLVFYHIRLKCYVIIDLKTDKLTHGDIGQMQMYLNYFDREVCTPEDNPTIGLILGADKNDAVVEYVLDRGNERIFASRYKLELPSKDELRRLLLEWRYERENGE